MLLWLFFSAPPRAQFDTDAHAAPQSGQMVDPLNEWMLRVLVDPVLFRAWSVDPEARTTWVPACVNEQRNASGPTHDDLLAWLETLQRDELLSLTLSGDALINTIGFATVPLIEPQAAARIEALLSDSTHGRVQRTDELILTTRMTANPTLESVVSVQWIRGAKTLVTLYRMPNIRGGMSWYRENGAPWRQHVFLSSPLKQQYPIIAPDEDESRSANHMTRPRGASGITYQVPEGTALMAQADGRIKRAGRDRYDGYYLEVEYPGRWSARYEHLQRFSEGIETGQQVSQGDVIGHVGRSGAVTLPQLSVSFYFAGRSVDPVDGLPVDYPLPPFLASRFENIVARVQQALVTEEGVDRSSEITGEHAPEIIAGVDS